MTTHQRSLAAQVEKKEIVRINPPLSKPASICAASKDILLCADDEQRIIMQLELEYNGVAIIGIVGKWPKNLFGTINIGPT